MIKSPVSINSATEDEKNWAAELLAHSEPWITLGITAEQCQKNCHDPGYMVYIAHKEGLPCGVMILDPRGVAGSPYIKSIAVTGASRDSGVGAEMMEFAEKFFRPQSRHLFLCVSSFNSRAYSFYERLGYRAVGEFRDYIIEGASEMLMYKKLR